MTDDVSDEEGEQGPEPTGCDGERAVTRQLEAALEADTAARKDYHVRAALQALVVEETATER